MPNSTKVFTFFVVLGCLVFTARSQPNEFPKVARSTMPVLAVLTCDGKGGQDKK